MRRNIVVTLFNLLLVPIFGTSLVFGQVSATGSNITGFIVDEQGATLSGVVVTVKQLQTNSIRETRSAEDGSFSVQQLPPGEYEVSTTGEGFVTKTTRLELVLGTTTVFTFKMAIGTTSEVIEVNASSGFDNTKTENSTNMERQRIDNLPINRRNFLDFSIISPRTTTDRLPSQGASATSGFSFNGQSARFNNITIDGVDNNDGSVGTVRSTFSQDAVQEFQVISDSYSAEFGRALGGIVNIITRSGSNEFRGSTFFLNRNDSISARDVFAPFNPFYAQYQFGAVLNGPIKKDKLFFLTSFERLTVKQNQFVTISDQSVQAARNQGFVLRNGPVPFSLNSTAFLVRVDGRINPNNTFWIRYNFGGSYNGQFEPFGSLVGETNGGVQRLQDNAIAANNTYINPGLRLVNETRFIYSYRDQKIQQLENGPQVNLVAPEGPIIFGRSTFTPQPRLQTSYQIVNNVSLTRGPNQIKFGADYQHTTNTSLLPFFGGGLAFFRPLDFAALLQMPGLPSFNGLEAFDPNLRSPQQKAFLNFFGQLLPSQVPGFPQGLPLSDLALPLFYAQGFGRSPLDVNGYQFSVFFQNDIKLRPNLTLKTGIRYDRNGTDFVPDNKGNFSPRIAITYNPKALPKLNIRASYGLFFGVPVAGPPFLSQLTGSGSLKVPVIPFPFSILPFALPEHHFPETNDLPPGVNFVPQLSLNFQYDPNFLSGYTQQISLALDYLISNNTIASLNYTSVRGIKIFGSRFINPIIRPNALNPVQGALEGRLDPTKGDIFEFESAFDSYYHGFTVSLNRRFSNRFGFLSSYTFSKAIDNFIDIRPDFLETEDPLSLKNERGLSLQNVRSRFVASGTWDLSYTNNPFLRDFQISSVIDLESGRPYNLLAGVDLNMNGDNPAGDRPRIGGVSIGRNVGITPGFAQVDVRLQRIIMVKERYRLQFLAEVFNLFNRVNISQVARTFTPDSQGNFNLPSKQGSQFIAENKQFRNAFSPRQLQFGFRVTF